MRVMFGMILGAVLTIGIAFVADTWSNGPATAVASAPVTAEHRNMVNWDVVGENLRMVRQHAREAWTTIAHKVTS